MTLPWRIELFGQLRAYRGEHSLTRFRTQKTAALLAYMAYHLPQQHSREVLIDLFWPDDTPAAGRHSLSMALSSLRRQLEPPGTPAGAVIQADRQNIGLNPAAVLTDTAAFETGLRAAGKATGRIEKVQLLAQTLDLYRGRLLPDFYDDWLSLEQERLNRLFVDAAHQMAALLEQSGEPRRALEYARRSLRVEPLREEAHSEVMRLLAAVGEPAAALLQYRALEQMLETDIGVAPSASLQALARRIEEQVGAVNAGLCAAAGDTGAALPFRADAEHSRRPAVQFSEESGQPSGTVTFLFIALEGPTALREPEKETFFTAEEHPCMSLRRQIRAQDGYVVRETGDGCMAAFAAVGNALSCALACRQELFQAESSLNLRGALHTGDISIDAGGDYEGAVLEQVARLLMAAHDGQILCSEETATVLRRNLPADVGLVDLGVYRLSDLPASEHVFELQDAALPLREFPPLRANQVHTGRLPLSFTRFFGREAEITELAIGLRSGQTRLITLTGPGGTGKTRLALETARRLVEPLSGAVWFVPLADISDPALIADAILDTLGLPCSGSSNPLEQAVRALSVQPGCLLLDNFEQLVDAGAPVVQSLLERVSTLSVLITSRQTLGITAEREFAVSALSTPQGSHPPSTLTLFGSVQLFLDRAQAVRPDFQVTRSNAHAVGELCDRLEGLPLAIELAAARVQVLTPAQMLIQMEQRFDFLVSRKRDVPTRHRTLRAAIDWSYHLLSPEMQRFFVRLSVFRGGWTMEAAAAVCEDKSALDLLAQLRECSLVSAAEEAGAMRFRMLESLREYAWDRLQQQGELEAVQGLHRTFFLALAEASIPHMTGPGQETWLERLEGEHENLRVALDVCLDRKEAETGLRLAAALCRFWAVRGHLREGRERCAVLLAMPEAQKHTQSRADALSGAAMLALGQGDHAATRLLYEESLVLLRELGEKRGEALALNGLGIVAHRKGEYAAAHALYAEGLMLRRAERDKEGIANSLNNLGALAEDQGDYTAADSLHTESLALRRESGNQRGIANSLNNLGSLAYSRGDYPAARALYEESLALNRVLGDKGGAAHGLRNLGIVAEDLGAYDLARSLHAESLVLERELENKGGAANALITLGLLQAQNGDIAGARASLEEALNLCRQLDDSRIAATAFGACARFAHRQRQMERAACLYGAESALRTSIGFSRSSRDQEQYDLHQAQLAALPDKETCRAAFAAGQNLTFEQAIGFALEL